MFGDQIVEYTIHFNNYDPEKVLKTKEEHDSSPEGPIVERKCPKCGNDKMSYATLQLRSADEGQTVFFTCLKCKYVFNSSLLVMRFNTYFFFYRFKESENS